MEIKGEKIAGRLYFLEFILSDRKFDWGVQNHVFKDRDILRCVRNHMKEGMKLTNQSITLYLKSIVAFLKVIMRYYWNQRKWTLDHWNNGNTVRKDYLSGSVFNLRWHGQKFKKSYFQFYGS